MTTDQTVYPPPPSSSGTVTALHPVSPSCKGCQAGSDQTAMSYACVLLPVPLWQAAFSIEPFNPFIALITVKWDL